MKTGDTYHNTCDNQPSTWTIKAIESDMVTVYSPQSDRSYTISGVIFEDTMRVLGFTLVNPQQIDEYQRGMEQYILAKVEGSYP